MKLDRNEVEQYALDHWQDFAEYLIHPSISSQNKGIN